MRMLFIAAAATGLMVAGTTAKADERSSAQNPSAKSSASQTSPSQTPSSQTSPSQMPSSQTSSSPATASDKGTTASASNEMSGVVKKVDKDKRSLKLSSPTGGEQELKIGANATITRDGSQAGLDQLKEGDDVRASLDPSSNQATKLDVQSKQKKGDSDSKSEKKTENKAKN